MSQRIKQDRSRRSGHAHAQNTQDLAGNVNQEQWLYWRKRSTAHSMAMWIDSDEEFWREIGEKGQQWLQEQAGGKDTQQSIS